MVSKNKSRQSRIQASMPQSSLSVANQQGLAPRNPKVMNWNRLIEWGCIALASGFAFWYLTARLAGVTVSVLIDEYVYVLDAHFKDLTESSYPNYLFQLVYSVTKSCGPDFYQCARGINAFFVVASAAVVYIIAIQLSKRKWLGAAAWLITIIGSYGTYTAYFMPEAIFNFFMILFFLGVARYGESDRLLVWLGLGFLLGFAALAKPHALFVVPAIVIYICLAVWSNKQKILKPALSQIFVFLGALLASKLGLGYLLAGESGFSLFGSYGYAVESGEAVAQTLSTNTWLNVPQTAFGQTLMIVIILGVAFPVALVGLIRILKRDPEFFGENKFRALFGVALLNMMAVSALFEAWQNLNTWMHTRYYSYLIPLAIFVLIEAYSRSGLERTGLTKRIVVGLFASVSIYALFTQARPFDANWIDAPDFVSHIKNPEISAFLIITSLGLAIFWLWNNKTSMVLAICLSMFASGFTGWHITNYLNETFGEGDAYQQVGRVLSNYLPQEDLDKTVIYGADGALMQRTLFYALSGGAKAMGGTIAEFDQAAIDPASEWFLVFGDALPQLGQPHLTGLGYFLYSLDREQGVLPRNTELQNFSNGCGEADNAGWVCGSDTLLTLDKSFPTSAKVDLVFDVGDNLVGKELEITLGESTGVVTAPAGRFAVSLSFQNSTEGRDLMISSNVSPAGNQIAEQRMIRLVSINVE